MIANNPVMVVRPNQCSTRR
ncbi:hypothetical protein Gotur_021291 [Gossypium turneri]